MNEKTKELNGKTILVTGGAGFIGYHLSKKLLEYNCNIIGFDNLNDYYEVQLKYDRLKDLEGKENYTFIKGDLADKEALENIFKNNTINIVVNLGAQAGVRYSIDNPDAYMHRRVLYMERIKRFHFLWKIKLIIR